MSDLKIPEDTLEYRSKELISDSLAVLDLLNTKTIKEIKDIFTVAQVIANYNAKLS